MNTHPCLSISNYVQGNITIISRNYDVPLSTSIVNYSTEQDRLPTALDWLSTEQDTKRTIQAHK